MWKFFIRHGLFFDAFFAGWFSLFCIHDLVVGKYLMAAIDLVFVVSNVSGYWRDRQTELDERGDEC